MNFKKLVVFMVAIIIYSFIEFHSNVYGVDHNEQSSEYGLYTNIASLIGAVTGISALVWKIFDYHKSKQGFMKLKIECNNQVFYNDLYVITKTYVENTSWRFVYIKFACIIIIDQSKSNIDKVICDLIKEFPNTNDFFNDNNFHPFTNLRRNNVHDLTRLWSKIIEYDQVNKQKDIIGRGFVLKPLGYYYEKNERLGTLENMSTTISHRVPESGIYSIYFIVIAENYFNGNKSYFRLVTDDIVVKNQQT